MALTYDELDIGMFCADDRQGLDKQINAFAVYQPAYADNRD